MKTSFSFFATAFVFCSLVVNAQQFSPTTGVPCVSCVPTNYTAMGTPFISDRNRPGLNAGPDAYYWNIYNSEAEIPPSLYSQQLPAGQGKNSFVSLKTSDGGLNDKLYLDVSGFDATKTYVFTYSVNNQALYAANGPISPYAESATMEIGTIGQNAYLIASQTTNFDDNNKRKWTTRVITFQPPTSTLRFKLSGKTAGQTPGYVHFSIDKYPFDCQLQPNQVLLSGQTTKKTLYPNGKLDLKTITTFSSPPAGTELVWKTGPNSTDPTLTAEQASQVGISNADPANVKPYYAFYYAKDFNCYNVPTSTAEVKFLYEPKQVPLKKTYIEIGCNEKASLVSTLTDLNDDAEVIWFNKNDHTGPVVYSPLEVPAGHYYAFYYKGGSYSLPSNQVSTAHVQVFNTNIAGIPDLGPTVNIGSLIFPPNGSKDFVVKMQNIKAENSNCTVFFKILKLPGFSISYTTTAGQSNVNGGITNNNDLWTFTEDNQYITVTAKSSMTANSQSFIGFKITRNANTPPGTKQGLNVTIPLPGGGGETNATNNQTINMLIAN